MLCEKCGFEKWGSAGCPLDDSCPKVAAINDRTRALLQSGGQGPVPEQGDLGCSPEPQAQGSLNEELVPPASNDASPSRTMPKGAACIGEALRRLEELDEFLRDALSDGDRAEARAMVRRVIAALCPLELSANSIFEVPLKGDPLRTTKSQAAS